MGADVRTYTSGTPAAAIFGGMDGTPLVVDSATGDLYVLIAGVVTKVASNAGLGTVTSVAATVPAEFSISGSPVTASGTLAITKATQTANLVWAGPTTGSAAAPTFRSLVTADIPGTLTITGGTINSAAIGGSTPAAGAFTTLSASGVLTITPAISMLSTGAAPTVGELTLVTGTKTVNTTAATATCKIFFQRKTAGGTIGFATTYTVNAGTSFTVSSDSALDTSVYAWWIVEAR